MPDAIICGIENEIAQTNLNYPRRLNRDLRPVIQNADIRAPRAAGSAIFITGVPSAVDTYRQFRTPVYAIFNALDHDQTEPTDLHPRLIRAIMR
jgi:hypothetical protein